MDLGSLNLEFVEFGFFGTIITAMYWILSSRKEISKKIGKFIRILPILFISTFFRFFLAPHFNAIYTDEIGYIRTAYGLTKGELTYNSRLGHPFINSIVFRIFGVNRLIPTYVSSFFDVLSNFLVYIISADFLGSEVAAVASMIFYLFSPLHLYLSGIGNTEAISNFFFLLSFYSFFKLSTTSKNKKWLTIFCIFLSIFSVQFRVESSIIPFI
ncbi:MAG: glycosyltransferase family 39 protein, partial [Candidatus Aenigmarchaeota archaeon]|nr:glycosyltransferase family 39 protein [Candidatus Aenigmarchaeota archaeon]